MTSLSFSKAKQVKKAPKKAVKKVKVLTLSKAKDRAWKAFSRFIRLRDCWIDTKSLECHCVTCGRLYKFGSTLHAGHFQPGRHANLLFDEEQVHAQCQICNRWRKGMWPEYYEYMVKRYGLERVQKMIASRNKIIQYKVADYLFIEEEYKNRSKQYEEKLSLTL